MSGQSNIYLTLAQGELHRILQSIEYIEYSTEETVPAAILKSEPWRWKVIDAKASLARPSTLDITALPLRCINSLALSTGH